MHDRLFRIVLLTRHANRSTRFTGWNQFSDEPSTHPLLYAALTEDEAREEIALLRSLGHTCTARQVA